MDTIEKIDFLIYAKRLIRKIETFTPRYISIQVGTLDGFPVTVMANYETWIACHSGYHWSEEAIFADINNFKPIGDCRCLELLVGGFMFEYDNGITYSY